MPRGSLEYMFQISDIHLKALLNAELLIMHVYSSWMFAWIFLVMADFNANVTVALVDVVLEEPSEEEI